MSAKALESGNTNIKAVGKSKSKRGAKLSSNSAAVKDGSWIYTKGLDLVVGCGGWSAPLLLLGYFFGSESNATASIFFYVMALAFNYPHYMATVYRAYHRRDDFSKYRFFTLNLTILLILTAVVTHWAQALLPFVFTLYLTWSPWHYTGQNFGITMMFANRKGAKPSRAIRNALYVSFLASYLLLFLNFHSIPSSDSLVLSIGIPSTFANSAKVIFFFMFLVPGLWSLWSLVRQAGWRAMLAPITLFSTQFFWFVLPTILQSFDKTQIPQTRYSSGVLAVMHSAQYLWITSYFARRESNISSESKWKPFAYFAILIIGGIALFVPGPWLVSYLFKYDFASSFLIFTALVNIHHFLLDGAIWKLRDKRIANLLLDTKEKLYASSEVANAAFTGMAKWFTGTSNPARLVRLVAAAALLILAGFDQAKYVAGIDEKNLQSLARAESLNPYDSMLKLRIARAQGKAGDLDKMIEALKQAIAYNPYSPEAQNSLAKLLLENQRYDEAFDHYKQMTRHLPSDADALINLGILAEQRGISEEAHKSWRKALAIDIKQKNAYLYLAESFIKHNQIAEAIPYYEQYLALLTSNPDSEKLDPKDVLYLTLKLAQAYEKIQQPERALTYYQQTIGFAEQSGEKVVESMAFVNLANLYSANGEQRTAARCYQRALALDKEAGDTKVEGADWFNFGQFLLFKVQNKRLAFACFLKAEQLLKTDEGTEREAVAKALKETETALANDAATIRRQPDALTNEALSATF
jgi:tetratricopeptide (TPR) repeat protein